VFFTNILQTTTTAGQTTPKQPFLYVFFTLNIPYYLRLSVYFKALSENIRLEFNTYIWEKVYHRNLFWKQKVYYQHFKQHNCKVFAIWKDISYSIQGNLPMQMAMHFPSYISREPNTQLEVNIEKRYSFIYICNIKSSNFLLLELYFFKNNYEWWI